MHLQGWRFRQFIWGKLAFCFYRNGRLMLGVHKPLAFAENNLYLHEHDITITDFNEVLTGIDARLGVNVRKKWPRPVYAFLAEHGAVLNKSLPTVAFCQRNLKRMAAVSGHIAFRGV